jgi:prepilin-type N-terminal cleavage/methylation domain-containing protein
MKNAFTLVEMLVAIVLISLLIGVAVFSFRLQLINVHKSRSEGIRRAIVSAQIHRVLESMKHYAVQDYDRLNQPIPRTWHEFFQGSSTRMLFVTTHPILSHADALVELSCHEGSLLYREQTLFGTMDFLRPALTDASHRISLIKGLQSCRFEYFDHQGLGHENYENQVPEAVHILLERKRRPREYFVTVKSENNLTATIIESDIDDEK